MFTNWDRRSFVNGLLVIVVLFGLTRSGECQSAFNSDRQEFVTHVRKQLLDGQYAELEKMAGDLRRQRPVFKSGHSKLYEFYAALSSDSGSYENGYGQRLQDRLEQVAAWHKSRPTMTTRILLAETMLNYAWFERGTGYADTITPQAAVLMNRRSSEAETLLKDAERLQKNSGAKDPCLYGAWMSVGMMGGFKQERMHKLLNQALEIDPQFDPVIDQMCLYLLPRWYGNEGDLLKLADRLALKTKSKRGEAAYAVVALSAHAFDELKLGEDGFSWNRVKQGLEDLANASGDPSSPYYYGQMAKLALLARDRSACLHAISKLNGQWHSSVFKDRRDYLRTETWATAQPSVDPNVLTIDLGPSAVTDAVFVKNNKAIAAVASTNQVQIRSTEDGSLNNEIQLEGQHARYLAASKDGQMLIYACTNNAECEIGIIDLEVNAPVTLGKQSGRTTALGLSPDEKYVVCGNSEGKLRRWQLGETPIPFEWPAKQNGMITGIAFLHDSPQVVTSGGQMVKVWHLPSREEWNGWDTGTSVWNVAVSPTQKILATSGPSNVVRLWSTADRSLVASLIGGNASISTICFSPDGKKLVVGTMSSTQPQLPGEVVVWDIEARKPIATLLGNRLGVWKVNVSTDGLRIASSGEDGSIRIWKMPE